jgi:hypothetical protein
MNKKQKTLTILALIAFGAIIFFHYYSVAYKLPYKKTYLIPKKATGDKFGFVPDNPKKATGESAWAPPEAATLITPEKPPTKKITADEFNKISYKDRRNAPNVLNEWVLVEYPATGPYLTSYPGLEDVRMALFALAVFYAGLFFVLSTRKG